MRQGEKKCQTPREPRYRFDGKQTVEVDLELRDGLESRSLNATLLDISRSGVRLAARELVPLGQLARLKFSFSELGAVLYVSARSCWAREGKKGTWILGCSLDPNLPDGFLSRLTAAGNIDRRSEDRVAGDIQIAASWNLNSWQTVRLVNYSPGGFCISASDSVSEEPRCHLRLGRPDAELLLVANVQWRLELEGCYRIGCSFFNGRDFERLREFV
jgi:hypothetical protein